MGSKTRVYGKKYFLDKPFWGELKFVKSPLELGLFLSKIKPTEKEAK